MKPNVTPNAKPKVTSNAMQNVMQKRQYPLTGRYMSGRHVRVRALSYDEVVAISVAQDKLNPQPEGRNSRLAVAGVESMVVEISEPAKKGDLPTGWTSVTAAQLDGKLGRYFTAKDVSYLADLFLEMHFVKDSEKDTLMGEAIPVED